jgi:Ca2+-binding RTX toxin-like protein
MATFFGTPGDDNRTGTAQGDNMVGLAGNDTLNGLGGEDTLSGGDGNDILIGGAGGDTLDGGLGSDFLDGGSLNGVDTADYRSLKTSGVFLDLAKGTAKHATGTDTLVQIENVQGTNTGDTITGDGKANRLLGDGGADFINGGGGNDSIDGGTSKDFIDGGSGADKISGGEGNDDLTGGSGADTFQFFFLKDVGVGASGRDSISDLEKGADKIDVSVLDANAALAGNQAFSFISTSEFSNEGQVRAFATNFGQLIQFNTTGDSVAEFEIFVKTPLSISASDFFL